MTRAWDAMSPFATVRLRHHAGRGLRRRNVMKTVTLVFVFVAATIGVYGQGHSHVIQPPKDAQWGPAPPFIPAGAQIAVLSGDPTKAVPYSVRLKFPANYAIPAHSHPTDENVGVVSRGAAF